MSEFLDRLYSSFSTYLFATPSFVTGVGSLLDLAGTSLSFNDVATPQDADFLAGVADSLALRADFNIALEQVSEAPAA